jgi:hypothetical protein
MAMRSCILYARAEIEKCEQRRDNGYWRCDEWAEEWSFRCPRWQPGAFICRRLVWIAKCLWKAYYWCAHKVCVSFKFTKVSLCALYVSSMFLPKLCGKILGFDVLVPTNPTSPFGPAVAYGSYINDEGEQTDRPIIMCWTETADPLIGSCGLRLRYEQLRHYSSPFHTVLPQFSIKVVDSEVSHRGPALTFFKNAFFLAYTGKDREHRIHVKQSSDGGNTWSNKVTLNASSLSGPALAAFNNRIYLAWKSKPREGSYLNIISSVDGITWENEARVVGRAHSGPALSTLSTMLFIAWNGLDDYRLNLKSSWDGISFENQVTLQETTDARPGLCAYGRHLYLAWKQRGRDGEIKLMRSMHGTQWEKVPVKLLPDRPLNAGLPALASSSEGLIIGWANKKLHIAGRR